MAFAHAQLLLYRPFLHYVAQPHQNQPTVDQRAFACASACISVSRNIIHITAEMKKRGLLVGAYWFSMYTTFFAIMSLLYFILENPSSQTSSELFRDAAEGKQLLEYFAKRSMAADRCSETLKVVIQAHLLPFTANIYRPSLKDYQTPSNVLVMLPEARSVGMEARHRPLCGVVQIR
jgi:hypothetical protein